MKKTFCITAILLFGVSLSFAQVTKTDKPKESTPAKMVVPIKAPVKGVRTAPETPPAPPPASNTIYYLTAARLSIVTGNDNKELLSRLQIFLSRQVGNIPSDVNSEIGLFHYMSGEHPNQEFRINTTNEITLVNDYSFPTGNSEGWRYSSLALWKIQDAGLELVIAYHPDFPLDAWKIEKVTLTVEFKNLAGNPHPTMGRVVIPFQNASKILNKENDLLRLQTDRFLLPKN